MSLMDGCRQVAQSLLILKMEILLILQAHLSLFTESKLAYKRSSWKIRRIDRINVWLIVRRENISQLEIAQPNPQKLQYGKWTKWNKMGEDIKSCIIYPGTDLVYKVLNFRQWKIISFLWVIQLIEDYLCGTSKIKVM